MADSHAKHHDYHLVDPSPWPLLASISALITAVGAIIWMHSLGGGAGVFGVTGPWVFVVGFIGVCYIAFLWWRDIIREAHKGEPVPDAVELVRASREERDAELFDRLS